MDESYYKGASPGLENDVGRAHPVSVDVASTRVVVDDSEIVQLCATDDDLFAHHFFPQTARQESPEFHREVDYALFGPDKLVNVQIFRGGAKTTKVRLAMAKRAAYTVSRTIMCVSKSQPHAARNLIWLQRQIEKNDLFRDTYGLKRGSKWNEDEMQVLVGNAELPVWIIGLGITGSARGVNIDDYRPDFILIDDVMDEENSATREQRDKVYKLVHGALKYSLAPRSENAWSKMVILQTPLDYDDISQLALRDPEFKSIRIGCWTRETEDLPVEHRKSAWPARWSSEELRRQRESATAKNELSIFSREMECKLMAPEQAKFRSEWLRFYGAGESEGLPPLHAMSTIMVIDPVPPPSENEVKKNLHGKDYEAIAVCGKYAGKIYILEIAYNRGHDPSWTIAKLFELAERWRVRSIKIEAVAYQKTLVWLVQQAMKKRQLYYPVSDYRDKRAKYDRIVDGIKPVASNNMLYVQRSEREFISQYTHYDNVKHDDVLEVVAIACEELNGQIINDIAADDDESDIPELETYRGAP